MSTQRSYEEELVAFARQRLGPASAAMLGTEEASDDGLRLLSAGGELASSALKVIYERLGRDPHVDNEFATYLLEIITSKGRHQLASDSVLRRVMNTGDLANSMLMHLWPKLDRFTFDSERQFTALLVQRMDYHIRDHLKQMTAQKRSEHKRVEGDPHDIDRHDADPQVDPELRAIRREEQQRLRLILGRLSQAQRGVLTLAQKGMSTKEIATQLGISSEAVRRSLNMAIETASRLMGRDKPHD